MTKVGAHGKEIMRDAFKTVLSKAVLEITTENSLVIENEYLSFL